MKPKFVKWMLFFIILAIVTAEELQKVSKIHERKIIVFQTRGLSRYSSKSITTLRPKVETISSTSDSLTSNTSRRTSEVRKNLSNRSNVSNINKRISQEQTTIKSKDEADIDQYSEKSKIFSSKAYNYESARLDPYVLDSKASISESRNNNIQNSKNSNTSNMDRRQLPENLYDKVKEAKQQDYSEINEISKFIDKSQTIGRRSTYLHNDGLKDKMKTTISSEPTKVINDSRFYTSKKIRNSTISVKQLNSVLPLNSRISRYKVNAKINLNSTLERAKNNQSSFQRLRRPILKSGSKFDITASGSESVHINIPLNFDDSKRVSSLTPINSIRSSTELPKPSSILRHRLLGRQTIEAKKISRGSSRRVNEYHRDLEVTNESFIRNRSKNDNSRKINTIIENNTTSLQLDVRKRMPKMKSLFRGSDDFRIPKTMNESQNNRKLNMSRGRYRMDVGSTIIGGPNQSQLLSLTSELLSTPGSIMKEIIVSSCIRKANITSTQPKSSALLTTSKTLLQSLTTMETILNLEKNTKDAIDKDNSQQNTGQSRKALKEDFFNHGLGFRGRRPLNPEVNQIILTSTIAAPIASTTSRPENIVKGNPGWTLRRRPGHWYDSLTSRPLTNPVEASISVQNKEVTSTTVGNTQRAGRRDNKTFAKVTERENKKEACESDNYPHNFKARLATLKKGDGKPRASVVASKMTSTELFTARSRIKLENARKLIKPELLIDETNIRHVIVYPFSMPKEDGNQKTNDSEVDEDQKVFQIARKWSLSSEKPKIYEKSSISSDWKPSKLRKNLKETQSAFSRYKQAYYTLRSKVSSTTTTSITEKDIIEKNYINHRFKSTRLGMFQKYRYRENKLHVPNPSHIDDLIQDDTIFTTKSSQFNKIHKMFTSRKNDKNYLVEDIKAVALKLRKPLESMEKSQSSKPPKKSDPMESSTTLLTTMRTVKSFSFSTRLVKIDDNDSINSATMKIVDNEMTSVSIPKSTSSPSVTKIITQNPIQNKNTTSPYENILASNSRPSYDVINEIANFDVSSTSEPLIRKAGILGELKSNWKELSESMDSVTSREYYQPRAAALTNDTGTPVFVVYPSATEKPMSIAITPKIFRYQATAKPVEVSSNQYQSATQKPIVNVKVSNSDGKSHTTLLQESILNSQKATTIISKSMNIFNPIKSAAILETGNITILDRLRTTVAPLLSTLAANSLLFSGVYKNTNSTNSLSRVTSSDASPKFSARFRDTEHYLRKPTTATTSLSQDSDHLRTVSQIDALSSSKPKILTFYRAMETASKSNKHTDNSTRAAAQRTVKTNIQSRQIFSTVQPAVNYPSLSIFSINIFNSNNQSDINSQSIAPVETTPILENSLEHVPITTNSSRIVSTDISTTTQQAITTDSYIRRFDTNRLTSTPTFSSSFSTTTPFRDYLIYGIYPNKTIVRKRPEVNLIDPRNVASPYVIFGVYPDGKLVRKFPNGSVIPDFPSNPVEVVFSLSTITTTNRPRLLDNQTNILNVRNKNVKLSNKSNLIASMNTHTFYVSNEVENALGFNRSEGFDVPNGSVDIDTNEMTATTTDTVVSNRKYKNYQIIQNQIRDGVTKTSNNESQHNSIFIGQDKFDNYGIQNEPIANPDVHNKNMNSTSVENSAHKSVVSAGPINKMIEIFSPVSNTINSLINTSIKETTTTISTLPAQTATTVTTMKAKTTQTPITTTEIPITTMIQAKNTIKTEAITTSSSSAWLDNETLKSNLNTFGTTFDDLAFLNALLEKPSSDESKPKKLTEVEQLLANKILFLALGRTLMNSGSLRSPKAIQSTNRSPNSFPINKANKLTTILPVLRNSSFEPKVIDFISLSTTNRPSLGFTTPFTWKPIRTFSSYQPPFMTSMTNVIPSTTTVTPIMIMTTIQKITAPTKSTYKTQTVKIKSTMPQTSIISTRKLTTPSSVINNRPTIVMRPQSSTVQIPLGPFAFATNLLQTIFGSNLFTQTTSRPVISRPVPTVKKIISVLKKVTTTKTATPAAIPIHENIQSELSQTPRLIQISNDVIANTNDQRASILNIFDTEKKSNLVTIRPLSAKQSTTFFPEDNAKSLATLLNVARNLNGRDSKLSTPPPTSSSPLPDISSPGLNSNDFLQVLSNGQSKIQSLSIAGGNNKNNESLGKTTERPTIPTTTMTIMSRTTTRRRSRSSTYHPPLFSDFSAFGSSDGNIGSFDRGEESLRSQVVNAAIGMTRAFGQFLEAAITGAAQQFQWFVRNGTRWS